jgi:uncharacterized membrane protein
MLSDVALTADELTQRAAFAGRTWLLPPVLYAATTGAATWSLMHPAGRSAFEANKLPLPETLWVLAAVIGALLAILSLYAAVAIVDRRRTGVLRLPAVAIALNGRLAPLAALPFLPALLAPAIERDSTKLTFFFIVIVGAIIVRGAYAWAPSKAAEPAIPLAAPGDAPADAPPPGERRRAASVAAAIAVGAIFLGYGFFFSWLAITNHHALNTRTIDLGFYDNIFYQSIHGRPLACTLIKSGYHGSAHFDPLLILLSPLYLLYPHAEMLLVLQSFWMGAGVIPVYLLARDRLDRRLPAVALAAMYALYPALQGANMYEFHSLSLVSTLMLWMVLFLERGNIRAYFTLLPFTLLCREDASLILCFVGLYAILSGRPRLPRLGWITILVSLVYFAIVKKFFMTSSDIFMSGKESLSFAYYYDDLIPNHNGVAGLVISIFTNPVFVLKTLFAEPKIIYLLTLFVPLLFLPFLAKTRRVLLVYGLLFCLLATRSAVFSSAFQYSNTLLPFAFAITPAALAEIAESGVLPQIGLDPRRLSRALVAGALAASLLCCWKFGGVLDNQFFHGGFSRVARGMGPAEQATYAWMKEQMAQIPPRASVATTNKLGAHVSNRKEVYFYLAEPAPTDFVFIDEAELHPGAEVERHNKAVREGKLVLVSRRDKLSFFKRGS